MGANTVCLFSHIQVDSPKLMDGMARCLLRAELQPEAPREFREGKAEIPQTDCFNFTSEKAGRMEAQLCIWCSLSYTSSDLLLVEKRLLKKLRLSVAGSVKIPH
jgi:hypothetical protein